MNSYIQLMCLIVSFIYGIFIYIASKFNIKVIKNKNIIIKSIINILFIFNISLGYVVILYYLNSGILHIYFILLMILGYGIMCVKKM